MADIYCECCKTPLGWKYVSLDIQFFFICEIFPNFSFLSVFVSFFHIGACIRVESEIQRRQIHNRIGTHDQGKQMGLIAERQTSISFNFIKKISDDEISAIIPY